MRALLTLVVSVLVTGCSCIGFAPDEGDGGASAGGTGGASSGGGGDAGGAAGGNVNAGGDAGGSAGGSSAGGTAGGANAGGTAGGVSGGVAGGAAGGTILCPAGQHGCSAACVSDDAVATCGDRCMPCPVVANATATCQGRVCGLSCVAGFELCLGQCVPSNAGPCGLTLPANTFVLMLDGGTGNRTQAAMAYSADAGAYLLVGGSRTMAAQPYDVLAMELSQRQWRNQHPPGTSWGPEVGTSTAPAFASERFEQMDTSGVVRPNFYAYGGMTSAYQYAWDEAHQRLYFYLWNRTFSYDARARAWTFHSPTTDPAGGPSQPRMMWGALGYDEVSDSVLLVGGGNVASDAGEPGTWLYSVAQNQWRQLSGPQPIRRAYSKLSVDPDRRKALLFGGDELDRLKADTWIFDFATETWTQVMPQVSPPPRAGHQLLFLPQSRATVLLGGWDYTSTTDYVGGHYRHRRFELWKFDWTTNDWALIKQFGAAETAPIIDGWNLAWPAAAGAGDVVLLQYKNGYPDEFLRSQTWALRVDPSVTSTTSLGVDAGTVTFRTGRYDPAWFNGPASVDAGIANVADNVWTRVTVPNRPATNHDWGTIAIDVGRRQLLRWSGGHSAYCGTDVLHFSLTTNRFSIGYPPEMPLEFTYSNDLVPGYWSFKRRPWMTGHTYKIYAFDSVLDRMIIYNRPHTHFYNTAAMDFTDAPARQDLGGDYYRNTLEPIPTGMAAWTEQGLFVREGTARSWAPLTLTPMGGATLPQQSPDQQSMVYDAVGYRLLLFPNIGADRGQVYEVLLGATKTLRRLDPVGRADLTSMNPGFVRESELVTSSRVVVVAIGIMVNGVRRMPVYDVAANRWEAWRVDPSSVPFGNSFAIAYDPTGDRIWALGQNNEPWVLKVNPATADKVQLN